MGETWDELRELHRRGRYRKEALVNPGVRRPTPVWALQEGDDQMRAWSRRHGAGLDLWGGFVAAIAIATLAVAELAEPGQPRWPSVAVGAIAAGCAVVAIVLAIVSARRSKMPRAVLVGRVIWAALAVAITLAVRAI